ncbi:hypothetical protein FD755_025612, partial [Muntiacus reevesi]
MGAAEPLRSVLWVKQQRCAVSLDPARALLRWWRSPGPGAGDPGAEGASGSPAELPRGRRMGSGLWRCQLALGRRGLGVTGSMVYRALLCGQWSDFTLPPAFCCPLGRKCHPRTSAPASWHQEAEAEWTETASEEGPRGSRGWGHRGQRARPPCLTYAASPASLLDSGSVPLELGLGRARVCVCVCVCV